MHVAEELAHGHIADDVPHIGIEPSSKVAQVAINRGVNTDISFFNKDYAIKNRHADLIIVSLHAGPEFFPLPSPRIKSLCRNLTDYGVSAIICHHSHIIASHEVYNSVPIFYGLGILS